MAPLTPLPQGHFTLGLADGEIAMTYTASGRLALIIAAGMFACLLGPLQPAPASAAPEGNAAQQTAPPTAKKKVARSHAKHVKKKAAPAKPAKPTAENSGNDVKAKDQSKLAIMPLPQATPQDEAQAAADSPASAALPPTIANANAQFPEVAAADGATLGAAPAASHPAGSDAAAKPAADVTVMAPDEVNDLDRAAADSAPSTTMAAVTAAPTANAQPSTTGTAQLSSASGADGAWDKASLIGKLFIAAGGLLTLASAARMFIA
ncbi:hypothetical protein LPW26_01230 [Rhodopseudomonas sp. HC1]|uniref:hypothetical protein n=1 Tax=Rhodopseudomonas infernalis TaxID=2897386 RepID=UPI001EE80B37|nr:hypothetical protein [Rhodopseudomonas infernalis]MCG6203246.1 hypothetical protein [Rhodopseudomonas infernalis]